MDTTGTKDVAGHACRTTPPVLDVGRPSTTDNTPLAGGVSPRLDRLVRRRTAVALVGRDSGRRNRCSAFGLASSDVRAGTIALRAPQAEGA